METTISKLNKHVEQLLKGINEYEPIEINSSLSHSIDKIACLIIMRHLDAIGDNHLSKKAILIGDLLSAHFYTLLANIQDSAFQLAMSKAIVKINEDKSSINQNDLTDERVERCDSRYRNYYFHILQLTILEVLLIKSNYSLN